ncbi:hypothetical protein NPIL_246081 [Nephila pilipes]|uniref:Uncharacterized protein n=1 Tax=Nephila pilipes TaxID=299642 RepID=A0A8X6IFN0_NEPPI|nr:hypothetical protein NPIL_246081 [Nephila pilipes]
MATAFGRNNPEMGAKFCCGAGAFDYSPGRSCFEIGVRVFGSSQSESLGSSPDQDQEGRFSSWQGLDEQRPPNLAADFPFRAPCQLCRLFKCFLLTPTTQCRSLLPCCSEIGTVKLLEVRGV